MGRWRTIVRPGAIPLLLLAALLLAGLVSIVAAVDKITTSTVTGVPAGSVEQLTPIMVTATVTPNPAGGWVNWWIDGSNRLSAEVDSSGFANATLQTGLIAGDHEVMAAYQGTDVYAASDSAPVIVHVVDSRTPVTVTVSSSANPALRGDTVTFHATVSPNPHGGIVELYQNGTKQAEKALGGNGSADIGLVMLGNGPRDITACFPGTTDYQGACSEPLSQDVHGIASSTTLSIAPTTVYPGDSFTIDVTVSPVPETTTTVWVGGSVFATIPIGVGGPTGHGTATIVADQYFGPLGTDDLRAYFPGTTKYDPSLSDAVTFTVRLDAATLTPSVSAGVHHVGDPITFSATVSPLPVVESAGVGFSINGPAGTGFGDNVGVVLGLDGAGETTVDTDGWPAGDYWYDVSCCGDPHLAPTTVRGYFTLIDVDAPSGDVTVAEGAPMVTSVAVDADVPASDGVGSGVQVVALSNDGVNWAEQPYDTQVPWALTAGEGTRTVEAKWRDQAGNWSPISSDTIVLDALGPAGTISIAAGAASTLSTSVTVSVPATDGVTGVNLVALSNDGTTWSTSAYAASKAWSLPAGSGTKTVWAKWQDGAGNWSAAKKDTIVLDSVAPSGSVSIAAGAVLTKTTAVTLSVAATDATTGLSQVALSNDGVGWTVRPYAASQAWTLPATNGTRTVWAKWKDVAGNWSAAKTDTIVLDTVAPTAGAPTQSVLNGSFTAGGAPVTVAWTGSDATSGIDHYETTLRIDSGAWSAPAAATSAGLSMRLYGHTYQLGVRAVDRAGNVGSWTYGTSFTVGGVSQSNSAVQYAGTWSTSTSAAWWGGSAKSSSNAGSTASYAFTGRSISWVSLKAANRGKAQVYVNGVLKATIDLYSATTQKQQLVWTANYTTSATRTVMIKVLGTSGRPRIDLDGFIVVR